MKNKVLRLVAALLGTCSRGPAVHSSASTRGRRGERWPAVECGHGHLRRVEALGTQSAIPASPEAAVLERVPNPHPRKLYLARFTVPEFTSLCPITASRTSRTWCSTTRRGRWLVESKSLKLLLASFPQPRRVPRGLARSRSPGGWSSPGAALVAGRGLLVPARRHADRRLLADGQAPAGLWIPDTGVAPYRGRG